MKDSLTTLLIILASIIIFLCLIFAAPGCNHTAFGSGLSAIGGVSTSISDNNAARISVGISTAVIGAVTSSLIVISKVKSDEFEQYCGISEGIEIEIIELDGGI